MVTKEEKVLLESLSAAFTKHGTKMDSRLDIINERITEVNESLVAVLKQLVKPRPAIETNVHNAEDYSTVGPGIIAKHPGKIPKGYKISGVACKYCQSPIAWAPFIPDSDLQEGQKREPPIHCDSEGNIKGDGRCPNL